jgi:predicted O-linked N-acetylglucosamine transferase (SPINDLY family)
MDYALSSALMEPEQCAGHYGETCILLPNLASCYPRPEVGKALEPSDLPRGGTGDVLYLCAQSLFKLLPQHDDVYVRIARANPRARFCFIGGRAERVRDRFRERLRRAFRARSLDADIHCRLLSNLPHAEFLGLCRRADVILDSFAWSGNNTSMEAAAFDKPIVTCPGDMMRARHSYGILQRLGITSTIADDVDSYVEIAVALGGDQKLRAQTATEMRERKTRLYDDVEPIRALERFFMDATR